MVMLRYSSWRERGGLCQSKENHKLSWVCWDADAGEPHAGWNSVFFGSIMHTCSPLWGGRRLNGKTRFKQSCVYSCASVCVWVSASFTVFLTIVQCWRHTLKCVVCIHLLFVKALISCRDLGKRVSLGKLGFEKLCFVFYVLLLSPFIFISYKPSVQIVRISTKCFHSVTVSI